MNNATTVTSLLTAEGFVPRFTFVRFATAVAIAETIAGTIGSPIARALFTAEAAADLARLDYQPFEDVNPDHLQYLLEVAEGAPTTPAGATEYWGSLLQQVE